MTSQDIRIPICCWANCDSQYTESPGMDVCDDPANLQHTPKIRMVLVFVRMLWALLCHLIKKKKRHQVQNSYPVDKTFKVFISTMPWPQLYNTTRPKDSLSHRERPGVHSSPTWLWVISDCGLVLSRDICSWSHSWTCSGSGVVWGGPGWCQVETIG